MKLSKLIIPLTFLTISGCTYQPAILDNNLVARLNSRDAKILHNTSNKALITQSYKSIEKKGSINTLIRNYFLEKSKTINLYYNSACGLDKCKYYFERLPEKDR